MDNDLLVVIAPPEVIYVALRLIGRSPETVGRKRSATSNQPSAEPCRRSPPVHYLFLGAKTTTVADLIAYAGRLLKMPAEDKHDADFHDSAAAGSASDARPPNGVVLQFKGKILTHRTRTLSQLSMSEGSNINVYSKQIERVVVKLFTRFSADPPVYLDGEDLEIAMSVETVGAFIQKIKRLPAVQLAMKAADERRQSTRPSPTRGPSELAVFHGNRCLSDQRGDALLSDFIVLHRRQRSRLL